MLELYPHYWIYYDMAAEDEDGGGYDDDTGDTPEDAAMDVDSDVVTSVVSVPSVDTTIEGTTSPTGEVIDYAKSIVGTSSSLTSIVQSGKAVTTSTHYWGKTKLNDWEWIEKRRLETTPKKPKWCGVGCFWDGVIGGWVTSTEKPTTTTLPVTTTTTAVQTTTIPTPTSTAPIIATPPPPPELIPDKKKIFNVNIFKSPDGGVTEKDIPVDGDVREIEISGTPGGIFSLDITKSDGCSILTDAINNVVIPGEGILGKYTFIQRFPATTKEETYEINLTPAADVQLIGNTPITTPTYSLAQYAGTVVTFTNTATIAITTPTATTLKGLVNKSPGKISTSSTSTGVSGSDYGTVSISWTIEKTEGTNGYLYVKKPPTRDDWSDNVSITRTVRDVQDGDCIKIEPHTVDIKAGMIFSGSKTIKKVVFACEDCTDCDKSSSILKLDSVDNLKVGMKVESEYIKNSAIISVIDEGCNEITISSKEIIKPSSILTFTRTYGGMVEEVLTHNNIKIGAVDKFIGAVELTFNEAISTTLSGVSLSSTSGTISPVISGEVTIDKFGKKNTTFTQNLDNILTYTPNAHDQTVRVIKDTLKEIDVLTLDTDENYRVKTPSIVANPSNGSLSGSDFAAGIGTIDYTPTTGFTGNDLFTFKVNDGTTDSETKTIYITVK